MIETTSSETESVRNMGGITEEGEGSYGSSMRKKELEAGL